MFNTMLLEGNYTEFLYVEYSGEDTPKEFGQWLLAVNEAIEQLGHVVRGCGVSVQDDGTGYFEVWVKITVPLTDEDREFIKDWLNNNPQQPAQTIKWRVPYGFKPDGTVDFMDVV